MSRAVALVAVVLCLAFPVRAAPARKALDEVIGPQSRFPTRAELSALVAAPKTDSPRPPQEVSVPAWEALGPFPGDWSSTPFVEPASPFQPLAQKVASRRKGAVVSQAAGCAARELGRFFLAHRGVPTPELKSWLGRLCALSQEPRLTWQSAQVGEDAPDEAVVAALAQGLEDGLGQLVRAGDEVGVWYGRSGETAVVMMLAAPRKTTFEPLPNAPAADGTLVVAGAVRVPAASVFALANAGPDGYSVCRADPAVRLPKFRFTCRVDPQDAATLVELGAHPPGRVIAERLGWLLARAPERVSTRWVAPVAAPKAPTADEVRRDVLRLVNERRTNAGLRPLREVVAQSRAVEALAPAFFVAGLNGAPAVWTELAMLGALAGYELPGRLEDGWFTSAQSTSREAAALFAALFEQPGGRRALMEPAATLVALGAFSGAAGSGLLVTTYDVLEPGEERTRTDEAVTRWAQARRAAGRPPLTRLTGAEEALRAAAEQLAAGASAEEVLPAALDAAAKVAGKPVRGGAATAETLLQLEPPTALAKLQTGAFALATAWMKAGDDSPWGRYVVVWAVAP